MKVVLFCGGMGMRIRPLTPNGGGGEDATPKPMVHVGGRHPLMWHVMKYYAHFGHTEFILCLGYGADVIKRYFLEYNEYMSNDFVLSGGNHLELKRRDIDTWKIHFVDTGLNSNVGTRLWKVRHLLEDDPMFLANYADGLSDLPHAEYQQAFEASGKAAGFVAVRPSASGHVAKLDPDGNVRAIETYTEADLWINGGYFILKPEVFDHMNEGEELVREPFQRLIEKRQLYAHRYEGFWQACDTFKEKQDLDQRFAAGDTPWQVWEKAGK